MPGVPYLPPPTRLDSSPNPPPVRTVATFDPAVVGGTRPGPTRRSRGPRAGMVLALLLLVVGGVATFVVVNHRSEATGDVFQADSQTVTATSTPYVDGLTTSTLVPGGADVVPPTIPPPIISPPVPPSTVAVVIVGGPDPVDQQLLDQCIGEQKTVFAGLQAFVFQTGAHPESPDGLAAIGWLQADPRGWNARWAFRYVGQEVSVVPVPGGACDL